MLIDSVDKLLQTADTILSTGVLNYQMAKIPIKSGLNVDAWEHHLCDYADKCLLQYIKFGYPLSISNPQELCNKEVNNHYSACQYPKHVQQYLDKEKEFGALLGPVNNIEHRQFHCSPLLTRPKDTDKRHIILNLSHPYGYMAKKGVKLHCYIIVVTTKLKATQQFSALCDLLHELGLPLNKSKVTPPTKRLTCLGIDIDIMNNTTNIAQDKLEAIYEECLAVRNKNFLSKQAFIKPSRIFVNRILGLFIQTLFLDACLTGMGAIWRNRVYATPIHNCGDLKLTIVHLMMMNIVIALRVWGRLWHHGSISVKCDNLSVVQVVKTGKTRDSFLALCDRNIWLFLT